jgi:hypothetical protein
MQNDASCEGLRANSWLDGLGDIIDCMYLLDASCDGLRANSWPDGLGEVIDCMYLLRRSSDDMNDVPDERLLPRGVFNEVANPCQSADEQWLSCLDLN